MTTIDLNVSRTQITVKMDGLLTSGMVGVPVEIEYDPSWDGISKTVVFVAGEITRDVLNADGIVTIPADVLVKPGEFLYVGIYGVDVDGTLVIPTTMTLVGVIWPGADPSGDQSTDPTLPVWAQLQKQINDLQGSGSGGSLNITDDGNGNVIVE